MTLFLIERNIAELLQLSAETAGQIEQVNEEIPVVWLYSFLHAYNREIYCLYEVNDPEALMEHTRTLGIPADLIFEVSKNQ